MNPPSAKAAGAALIEPRDSTAVEQLLSKSSSLLIAVADALSTTLDLDAVLQRTAELVREVIDYEIFAILLVNEKTQDLRMRFQIGHTSEVEKIRIKVGQGVTGSAAQRRDAILVRDVTKFDGYINANPRIRSELAVPLILKNKVIGVIDIASAQEGYFTEEHRQLLTLVGSRLASAIENARLYTRVSKQAQTLQVLNEIAQELTSILNLDQLLKRVGDLLSRVIDYQMFSILLLDPTGTKLQHRFSVRFKESIHLKHDIPLGRGVVGYAARHREPVLVPDVSKDPRYINLNPETRSELSVPLIYKGQVIGVFDIEHTRRGFFTEDHMRTISTLAAQIAVAIENARLYERIAQEEQRLERDLSMAREVQVHLMPPSCPVLKNAELAARFVPARVIGGDMYDFLDYAGERTGIAIFDVSGKGAPAALYAALASGLLRSIAATEPTPAEMLHAINLNLNERRIEAQFVSMIYAVWDDQRSTMHVANSGMPRPAFCKAGKVQTVDAAGLPLGLFETAEYEELAIAADAGDVFVFFSDGMIDATNPNGDNFGRNRILELIQQSCDKSADELVDALFQAVTDFSAGEASFDDETVVAVKVTKSARPEISRARTRTSAALRRV